ncbi:MAG: HEAT repeat domain-containing protein [Polyangiaceae bacterium]
MSLSPLERCLHDPGYTPARADLASLVSAVGTLTDKDEQRLQRALVRAGWAAAELALAAWPSAREPHQGELVALLGRFAADSADERLRAPLEVALSRGAARARRMAALALGKLGDPRAEPALLNALDAAPLDLLRAIAEALGKVGAEAAVRALSSHAERDGEFVRRKEQALLLIARRLGRSEGAAIELERPLGVPWRVRALCRRGLAHLLEGELSVFGARVDADDSVELASYDGTLRGLLLARCALSFGLVTQAVAGTGSSVSRIAQTLNAQTTLAALRAWSAGRARFRVVWQGAGHQRAASWALSRELSALDSELTSDPRDANWLIEVGPGDAPLLRLVPQFVDPRFAYRRRDVPAASHPTVAAALARVAGVRPDDVVWDPFVGSGLELVERALLGPYARLIGSDLDVRALEAARDNLTSAGVRNFELVQGDARTLALAGVTLIISNPPMGRRVARDGSLPALLEAFVAHTARVLVPGGRAVLLSPLAERTSSWARKHGLDCRRGAAIDLGGFNAELQCIERRAP